MISAAILNRAPLRLDSIAGKLAADGNSIVAGTQDGPESNGSIVGYLSRHFAPFTGYAYANVAIGGQDTDAMINAPSDIDASYDGSKVCLLFLQEGTNQVGGTAFSTAAVAAQKMLDCAARCKAANPWERVVIATVPPVYVGDHLPQSSTDTYNATLDTYNAILRRRYREVADLLFETRQPGSPYDQARYPNYLKATFFIATSVPVTCGGVQIGSISNDASWITEPSGGPVPNTKIHYTAAGIALLAPFLARDLRRLAA